jgi:RNA ligase
MKDPRLMKTLRRNLQTITLEELFGYINEIEGGYIRVGYHPEDNNIVILNYTELTTFERRWNKYTMSARGLILDLTDVKNNGKIYILAKPFEKFFNYGEMPDYEKDIDITRIETVMEKMDGSMGVSYFFHDEIRFATRGSFVSEQAVKATEIWRKKYAGFIHRQNYVSNPYTIITEIIYPQNRVVVDYGSKEDLVLLGIRNLHISKDFDEFNLEGLKFWSYYANMPMAGIYEGKTIHDLLEDKKNISANEEGWILKFPNGKRLKVKGDEYIQAHKIMYGLSDKAKVKAWSEGELEAYIMMLPEEFRPELEGLFDELELIADMLKLTLDSILKFAQETTTTKKEFALHVNSAIAQEYRGFIFKGYGKEDGVPMPMIKDYIYKNYEHYLEVIAWKKKQDS